MSSNILAKPEISNLHWRNSANVLCNYMKKPEYLKEILKNQAIIPRYVVEPLDYLEIEGLYQIVFPMTCFCDIPFSKVGSHMTRYGRYGIAFDKQQMIKKFRIQPIHYINPKSPLANDFREAFAKYYRKEKCVNSDDKVLLDYILSTLLYMKPIFGLEKIEREQKTYIFQDECEWRFIPSSNFLQKNSLPIVENQISEKAKNAYSKMLKCYPETWICYDWDDIKYIIVPDELALIEIIELINELPLEEVTRYLLISKIEISNRFEEDLL